MSRAAEPFASFARVAVDDAGRSPPSSRFAAPSRAGDAAPRVGVVVGHVVAVACALAGVVGAIAAAASTTTW